MEVPKEVLYMRVHTKEVLYMRVHTEETVVSGGNEVD